MKKRVIIVGGGPAGLSTAYSLLSSADIILVIIKQENIVGGLAGTILT